MNAVYGIPKGHKREYTSDVPTMALSELQPEPQTKGDAPVGAQQPYSDAKATQLAKDIVWLASFLDNVRWLREETEARNAQPPTVAEFSVRVEAEIAKGLSEVEALHTVAADHPEFYDAYRNAAFTDGRLPGS
jgi:hypothetical protein